MSRSPNRHNKIFIKVEPLAPDIIELIRKGELSDTTDKKTIVKLLRDHGWDSDTSRTVVDVDPRGNLLCEETKGRPVPAGVDGHDALGLRGRHAERPPGLRALQGGQGHAHALRAARGPGPPHIRPAHAGDEARHPRARCSRRTRPSSSPSWASRSRDPRTRYGAITGVISGKRGKLINIEQREVLTIVEGEIPAAETLDLSEKMRGATAGRAVWNTYFKLWQAVPTNMLPVLVERDQEAQGPPRRSAEGLRVHRQRVGEGSLRSRSCANMLLTSP